MRGRNVVFASLIALLAASGLAQADQVQIRLWHMEQPPQRVARVQQLIDEFNKSNPGIVVKQEPQNWGEVYAKAPAAIAAGNAPEILFAIPDFTTVIRSLGALTSVKDFTDKLNAEHHFIPATLRPYEYDGGVWAVPLYNMAISLWYRHSVFDKAGLKPPQTWSEWRKDAETLTKAGMYGAGLPANKQLYTDQTVYAMMVNNGAAQLFNDDGSLRFNNPKTVEAFSFYKDMFKYSAPDATNWTWGEAEACFDANKCGTVLQFTVISTYNEQGGDPADLGVAAVPRADTEASSNTISYSNAAMILAKDPAKRQAAERFISFLLEPANYGRFLNMEPGLFLPATEDGAKAPSFWNDPLAVKYKLQIETMIANSQHGMLFGFTTDKVFPSIGAISAQNILAETLQRIVTGGETPAAAVAAGQKEMEQAAK
ncbi:MAG TPA: ABC transporter substrate-binding protein [Roseiarcus sp.]|nr:ABC transporter substrate-binding protein [Roseiarcus sp.]